MRQSVVDTMAGWVGAVKGSAAHKTIIDIYNTIKPLPRGVRMSYAMDWCAACVSAAFQAAGLAELIPAECSCGEMMRQAQARYIWVEDDGYRPQVGDLVMYDWQDDGKGDNRGAPDHVGLVEGIFEGRVHVLEGNTGYPSRVGRRSIDIGGRFIRGYIVPQYASAVKEDQPTNSPWYAEAMDWCKSAGIMDGTRPLDTLTRAEAATIIKRTVEYLEAVRKD
jgi:hypothetical protein